MSPRGPRAAVLLMFLMLTLMSSWPTADGRETQYAKFQQQHIDELSHPPFSDAYCNTRMKKQKMTTPKCKDFNTFIHSDLATVKAVCARTGTKRPNNRYYSNDSFSVADCKFIRKDPRQGCVYKATTLSQRICITCEQVQGPGLAPVHYGSYKECFPSSQGWGRP
ncbi:ribonuclease pancreatic-like [Alligator mississippiensis]|uniref:ribonuclease pancreatic-like n=1 Tax=Alligator mississippiensis TaxID=8496 RepID=UPI0028774427|nr:ribonuclease pancreatic-like [Alligator mississippiensis]